MCFTIVRLLVKPLKIERIVKNENFNPIILSLVLYFKLKSKTFVIQLNLFCISIENIQLFKLLVSKFFCRVMADYKMRIKC